MQASILEHPWLRTRGGRRREVVLCVSAEGRCNRDGDGEAYITPRFAHTSPTTVCSPSEVSSRFGVAPGQQGVPPSTSPPPITSLSLFRGSCAKSRRAEREGVLGFPLPSTSHRLLDGATHRNREETVIPDRPRTATRTELKRQKEATARQATA